MDIVIRKSLHERYGLTKKYFINDLSYFLFFGFNRIVTSHIFISVMGGYDFPGSNSNIDLYALTGWIPERTSIKQKDDSSFNKDEIFRKLFQRFHKGDVLVTLATGEMSDAEADRAGLVPTHAYAMLDIREVNGIRLFLLKNPWAHLRWKGNYSETDNRNWTPEMMKALSYDPKNAQNFDNGVFWVI